MPDELKDLIDAGYTQGGTAYTWFYTFKNDLLYAGNALQDNDVVTAGGHLINASASIGTARNYLLKEDALLKGLRRYWRDALYWINDNWPVGAEVTMDAILSAMLGANFEQLQYFIGLVDAYRVALWNAPFNADFYAALARGFQKWP